METAYSQKIAPSRANELVGMVFKPNTDAMDYYEDFTDNMNIHENVFLHTQIAGVFLPKAIHDENVNDVKYFKSVDTVLLMVIKDRLKKEENLYTLQIPDSDKLYIKNNSLYVLYTDAHKDQGEYTYRKLSGIDELNELIIMNRIEQIIVSDGPNYLAIVPRALYDGLEII